MRLVLHLVGQETEVSESFADAIVKMRKGIKDCKVCHNISDQEVCEVCSDRRRDHSLVCVVESIRDVMAIEDTGQFRGVYHVLGGVISPIEGVGPSDIMIHSLVERVARGEIKELIMAISPTIEGDTTIFFVSKQLENSPVKITTIARGISFGGELEYADELTLGRSIVSRIPYRVRE